jgi:hypothetical protein
MPFWRGCWGSLLDGIDRIDWLPEGRDNVQSEKTALCQTLTPKPYTRS